MARTAVDKYLDLVTSQQQGLSYYDAIKEFEKEDGDESIIEAVANQNSQPSQQTTPFVDPFLEPQKPLQTEAEGNFLTALGTGLWAFGDEAAFGLPELVAKKGLGADDLGGLAKDYQDQTGLEASFEALGRFAGFVAGAPLKLGVKALKFVGGKAVNKVLKEQTTEQIIESVTAKAAKEVGKKNTVKEGLDATIKESGNAYRQLNFQAKWSKNVADSFNKTANANLDNIIKKRIKLGDINKAEGDALKKIFKETYTKQSVSDFVGIMQRKYIGKKGAILGEILNEAIVWGTIDAVMELPRSISEDRKYDWMQPIYGVGIGALLGRLSFLRPGGKQASFGKTMKDGLRALFNSNMYKDLNLNELQSFSKWNASNMAMDLAGNKINKKVNTIVKVDIDGKPYDLDMARPKGSLAVDIDTGKPMSEALQKKILKKALDNQRKKYGREIINYAVKEEWGNFVQVWPRMLAGGAIMSAPEWVSSALSGEDVAPSSIITNMLIGGYIMRRGYGASWDIQADKMARLRRGMTAIGLNVESGYNNVPLLNMTYNESIDPYRTNDQLSDLKSTAQELGVITDNIDSASANLGTGRTAQDAINDGSTPLFAKFWSSLMNPGESLYRTELTSIPESVAKDMETRLKDIDFEAIDGKLVSPSDFDIVYNNAIDKSIESFSDVVAISTNQILKDGLGANVRTPYDMGAIFASINADPSLKKEARKGADGKLGFLFENNPDAKGDAGEAVLVNIISKANTLLRISKVTGRATENTNPDTQHKILGNPKEDDIDTSADKLRIIKGTIEGLESYLTKELGGKLNIDLSSPYLDIEGLMISNASKIGMRNIALAFSTDEASHADLQKGLAASGLLIQEDGEFKLPNRLGNLDELIHNVGEGQNKQDAINLIKATYDILGALGQYKGTDTAMKPIDFTNVIGSGKSSLATKLSDRKISRAIFAQNANRIASDIVSRQIEDTKLNVDDVTFLNSLLISEELPGIASYNPIGTGKLSGFTLREVTSIDPSQKDITDNYNRIIREISERSRLATGERLVVVEGESSISDPVLINVLNNRIAETNKLDVDYNLAGDFLMKFFNAVEGNAPLKKAVKDFIDLNPTNSGRLIAMLRSTAGFKVVSRMGDPDYQFDPKAVSKILTDENKSQINRFVNGFGSSIDSVDASMTESTKQYHSDFENLFSSGIGQKNISQGEYFKNYFSNVTKTVDQNMIIHKALSMPDNSNAVIDIIKQVNRFGDKEVTLDNEGMPVLSHSEYSRLVMDTMGLIAGRLGSDKITSLSLSNGSIKSNVKTIQRNPITNYIKETFGGDGLDTFMVDAKLRYRDDARELQSEDITMINAEDLRKDPESARTQAYKEIVDTFRNIDRISGTKDKDKQTILDEINTHDSAGIKRGIEIITLGEKVPFLGVLRRDYDKVETEFIRVFKEFQKGGKFDGLITGKGLNKLKAMMDSFGFDPVNKNRLNQSWNNMHTQAFKDLVYLKMLGAKDFGSLFSTGYDTAGNNVAKVLQRFNLAFTASGKRMSKELYTMASKALSDPKFVRSAPKISKENRTALTHYINRNKYGVAIYNDNVSNADVSIRAKHARQMNDIYDVNKEGDISADGYSDLVPAEARWDNLLGGRDDVSGFDSIAYIGTRKARALSAANGAEPYNFHSIFKPIISSNEDGAMLYGKTVFVYDPYVAKNVIDKNDRLDVLLMDTGAKLGGGERIDLSLADMTRASNENNFLNKNIVDYDLSSLAIVQVPKKEAFAKFGQQITSYMSEQDMGPIFEAYYQNDVNAATRMMDDIVDNAPKAREFMLDGNNLGDDFALQELTNTGAADQLGAMSLFLQSSKFANPQAFGKNMLMNALKRKIIDRILNPDSNFNTVGGPDASYGGKAVLIQSMDPKYRNLKGTHVVGKGEDAQVLQYGEAVLPGYEYDTPLRELVGRGLQKHKFGLRFIKRNEGSTPDEVYTKEQMLKWIEDSGQKKTTRFYERLANVLTNKPNDINTLGQLHEFVVSQMPGFQIAIATTRYPRTRANDLTYLGINGFLDSDYGNSMIINDHDVLNVFEGDYDVDKSDYFFQGTDAFWNHIENVKKTWTWFTDPGFQETMDTALQFGALSEPEASLNNEQFRTYVGNKAAFGRSIGEVQKLNRTLGHLGSAVSTVKDNVIAEYVKNGEKFRVRMNYNNQDEMQRRAFETQAMIDGKANFSLFKNLSLWRQTILFPDYNNSVDPNDTDVTQAQLDKIKQGKIPEDRIRLFIEEKEVNGVFVSTERNLSEAAREGILNLLDRHSNFLTLGTEVYQNGIGRTPTYNDMMQVSENYFVHAENINQSLYNRHRYRVRNRLSNMNEFKEVFKETKIKYTKTNGKETSFMAMADDATFYHPDLVRYYKSISSGDSGSPLERSMYQFYDKDPLRQRSDIMLEGGKLAEMNDVIDRFIDNKYNAEEMLENLVGINATVNSKIKAIKYLKRQFYKIRTQKQKDGLNKAIRKHESVLINLLGKRAMSNYLSTQKSADLPDLMKFTSIENDPEIREATIQMYTLSPVLRIGDNKTQEFKKDMSMLHAVNNHFYGDEFGKMSSTMKFGDTTLLTAQQRQDLSKRADLESAESIIMQKLTEGVDKHGIIFLWKYAAPAEGQGVTVFNNRVIPSAAKSSGSRYRRMLRFLGERAKTSDYYAKVLSIVSKRDGMYRNLFDGKTNLIPDADYLLTEQIRMPDFNRNMLSVLDNYTSVSFQRNKNDMSPLKGGMHYDNVIGMFRELYKMAGQEQEFNNFQGKLSKLHEMDMGLNLIDPATYLLTMENIQTDLYNFVKNDFNTKQRLETRNSNEALANNELYLMLGGDNNMGQGITLNLFNSLNSYNKTQRELLAGQASEVQSTTLTTKVEDYLYSGCGGRAS